MGAPWLRGPLLWCQIEKQKENHHSVGPLLFHQKDKPLMFGTTAGKPKRALMHGCQLAQDNHASERNPVEPIERVTLELPANWLFGLVVWVGVQLGWFPVCVQTYPNHPFGVT